ncbi:patr class I histocompatibility antigen, B-2 alpha chain-like [Haplochromis burtoni]|uniref:patr class I histocompatibility antigen, B-2 alpha chain-like n=1 Tax=Haplochromis burtoni TaxID=8153 RepID=UPI001C2D8A07|nr:patr class I histocompatibility antigen, B-2 alpha chain-like [Haplochromis burtoni]
MCHMFFVTVLVLLGAGLAANSEIHSLTCIYTALSKPGGTPGIHKFTAMGLLDGRRIEYYDSESERKGPKQEWMRECLSAEYWGKGTEEQWLESLMNRKRQNDSVVHVLQGMRGCEGKMQPDGTLKFHRAMHTYAYDGNDLLSFDSKTKSWIQEAQLTMREWDSDQAMKERIKGYLENVCIKWLKMFLVRGEKQLEEAPQVQGYAQNSKDGEKILLTCIAKGQGAIDVQIKRNGETVTEEKGLMRSETEEKGLMRSGTEINKDGTLEIRAHVEISKDDKSKYSYEVIYEAPKNPTLFLTPESLTAVSRTETLSPVKP